MKYIFLFTLSPVQSFIAQARKTQDLYAGSQILSELAKEAAVTAKSNGIDLVFPQNTEGGNSFPNRFIGTTDKSVEELQAIGQTVEDAVNKRFKDMAQKALEKVKYQNNVPLGFWQQIENHLDINWLFHPITEGGYAEAYKQIEPLMASLKNTRFITNHQPEAGRKCSLDGERNALFFGKGTNNKYVEGNNAKIIGYGDVWLNENEGLSAVSLVKRTYRFQGQKEDFPSTASVALAHHIQQLDILPKTNYGIYKSMFGQRFDEQLCYKDNLNQKYLEQNGYKDILNKSSLSELQKLRSNAFGDRELQKYYAIIAFDGDKMGELLSGVTRRDKNSDLAAFQSKVSATLMTFSKWIYDTLDKKQIDVVYSGGDDFLGFVNLHNLFEVVKTLRLEFDKQVNQALKDDLEANKPFTFSMGITIAHYKTPLSIVLQTARDMEKKAKNEGNRNAFAIAALKHSGETHRTYFNWHLDNVKQNGEQLPKWNALKELVAYFNRKDCSDTFLRSLEKEFYLLQDEEGNVKNVKKEIKYKNTEGGEDKKEVSMIPSEILRLATKSLVEGKKDKANHLKETTLQLFEEESTILYDTVNVKNGIEAVKVALFIKRQTVKNGN